MQGLVGCLNVPRIEARRHRLNALALARQQQAGAIAAQRINPVGVTDLFGKSVYVSLEPDLTSGVGRNRQRLDHAGLYGDQLGSYNRLYDTVRVVGLRSSEEHGHSSQVLGDAHAAVRDGLPDLGLLLAGCEALMLGEEGIDFVPVLAIEDARRDRVHVDAVANKVEPRRLGEADDGGLGGAIDRDQRLAAAAGL